MSMKLALQLKLLPTTEQHAALLETIHAFNAAASHAAQIGLEAGVGLAPKAALALKRGRLHQKSDEI